MIPAYRNQFGNAKDNYQRSIYLTNGIEPGMEAIFSNSSDHPADTIIAQDMVLYRNV